MKVEGSYHDRPQARGFGHAATALGSFRNAASASYRGDRLSWLPALLNDLKLLLRRPPPTTGGSDDHFDPLIIVRHKPVLKDIPKPSCLCRVSGRNGGQSSHRMSPIDASSITQHAYIPLVGLATFVQPSRLSRPSLTLAKSGALSPSNHQARLWALAPLAAVAEASEESSVKKLVDCADRTWRGCPRRF